jgi:hypothetical protein
MLRIAVVAAAIAAAAQWLFPLLCWPTKGIRDCHNASNNRHWRRKFKQWNKQGFNAPVKAKVAAVATPFALAVAIIAPVNMFNWAIAATIFGSKFSPALGQAVSMPPSAAVLARSH